MAAFLKQDIPDIFSDLTMGHTSPVAPQNTVKNIQNISLAVPQMKRITLPEGVPPTELLDVLFNISSVQRYSRINRIRFDMGAFMRTIKSLGIFEFIESNSASAKYLSGFRISTDANFHRDQFELYPQLLGFSVISPKYSENAYYKNTPNSVLSDKRDGMIMMSNNLPINTFNNFLNVKNHFYYYDIENILYFEQKLLLHFTTSDIGQFARLKMHVELLEHIMASAHLRLLAAGAVNHAPAPGYTQATRELLDNLVTISNNGIQVECMLRDTTLSVLRPHPQPCYSGLSITL